MPPPGNRQVSDTRCKQGWELRKQGRTWQDIADELGYRSRQASQQSIQSWLKKNPPDDVETLRRATGDILVNTIVKLTGALDEAQKRGELRTVAELGKAIFDGCDRHAKLTGQHLIAPTEINVNVSVAEMIASTRQRILDAIDAEVVDVREIE